MLHRSIRPAGAAACPGREAKGRRGRLCAPFEPPGDCSKRKHGEMTRIDPATLHIALIATAPVKPGEEFGPCLLTNEFGDWFIGCWSGKGWFDAHCLPCEPVLWALLPKTSVAFKALEGAEAPPSYPIETAPVVRGDERGPRLLLFDAEGGNWGTWFVGFGCSGLWYDDEGIEVHPTRWAPLPAGDEAA